MATTGLSRQTRARAGALFCLGVILSSSLCVGLTETAPTGETAPDEKAPRPMLLMSATALLPSPGDSQTTRGGMPSQPSAKGTSDTGRAAPAGGISPSHHGLTGFAIPQTNGLEGITVSLPNPNRDLTTERIRFDAMNTKDGVFAPDVVRAARQMRIAGRPSAWGGLAANRPRGFLQAFNIFAPYPEDGPGNGLPASEATLYDRPTPRIERNPLTHEPDASILTFSCDR